MCNLERNTYEFLRAAKNIITVEKHYRFYSSERIKQLSVKIIGKQANPSLDNHSIEQIH